MTARVERLGPEDWRRFRGVRQASLRSDPAAFADSAHRWLDDLDAEPAWRARLEQVTTFVAARSGVDVGTAGVSASGELVAMWVDPDVRGSGVGDLLVAAVVGAAPHAGVHLRVMAGNSRGVRFYERCGFRLTTAEADAEGCLSMAYAPTGAV